MQIYDAIIIKKKVRYLDPAVICEAAHASPKWMPDTDDYLKTFPIKKEKQKARKKFHEETITKVASYISVMMTSSKSNIDHFIINYCSDPCLQNIHNIFFLEITRLLSLYNKR